MIETEVLL